MQIDRDFEAALEQYRTFTANHQQSMAAVDVPIRCIDWLDPEATSPSKVSPAPMASLHTPADSSRRHAALMSPMGPARPTNPPHLIGGIGLSPAAEHFSNLGGSSVCGQAPFAAMGAPPRMNQAHVQEAAHCDEYALLRQAADPLCPTYTPHSLLKDWHGGVLAPPVDGCHANGNFGPLPPGPSPHREPQDTFPQSARGTTYSAWLKQNQGIGNSMSFNLDLRMVKCVWQGSCAAQQHTTISVQSNQHHGLTRHSAAAFVS